MKQRMVKMRRFRIQYADDLNPDVIHAAEFDQLNEAIEAGERTHVPFLVMETTEAADGRFSWVVLPHGSMDAWKVASGLYQHRWPLGVTLVSAGLVALILYGGDEPKARG